MSEGDIDRAGGCETSDKIRQAVKIGGIFSQFIGYIEYLKAGSCDGTNPRGCRRDGNASEHPLAR